MSGGSSMAMIAQHILVLFLIVAAPLWDRYEIPRLKASTDPEKKVRFYKKIMAASWACAVVAAGLVPVYRVQRLPGDATWMDAGTRSALFLQGLTAGMLLAIFVPAVLALKSRKIREKAGKAAKKLAFLLPSTGRGATVVVAGVHHGRDL